MEACRRQASNTVSGYLKDISQETSPAYCCCCYFISTFFCLLVPLVLGGFILFANSKNGFYVDLFTHSVSVSKASHANTNDLTTDWKIGLIAKTPVSGCKISLQTIKSSLLRGDKVMSELSSCLDGPGQNVTFDEKDEWVTTVQFNSVVMKPGVSSGVVWDFRVEIVAQVMTDAGNGFLNVICSDIPVNFTSDLAGNMVKGSLLGNIRRCDYLVYRDILDFSS